MAEIVNLRRVRKAKSRGEREKEAADNRAKHGVPKPARDATKANTEKEAHALALHKIDRDAKD